MWPSPTTIPALPTPTSTGLPAIASSPDIITIVVFIIREAVQGFCPKRRTSPTHRRGLGVGRPKSTLKCWENNYIFQDKLICLESSNMPYKQQKNYFRRHPSLPVKGWPDSRIWMNFWKNSKRPPCYLAWVLSTRHEFFIHFDILIWWPVCP